MTNSETRPRNGGAAILGWMLIGLGALFLAFQVFNIRLIDFLWPFFIIVPGLLFFVGMAMGRKSASPLAIPGSVITGTGLLLFYQNLTNHWESWAYAWTLYVGFVGVGIIIHGAVSDRNDAVKTGYRLIGISLAMFLAFGIFFELIINISNNPMGNVFWPGLLILAGLYMLLSRGKGIIKPPEAKPKAEVAFEPLDMSRSGRGRSGARKTGDSSNETAAE